jgi:hypothetical protein
MTRNSGDKTARIFSDFLVEREAAGDWLEYAHANRNGLSRNRIAEKCKFGRSVFVQNPLVKTLLAQTEERLKRAGILGAVPLDGWGEDCASLVAEIEMVLSRIEKKANLVKARHTKFEECIATVGGSSICNGIDKGANGNGNK